MKQQAILEAKQAFYSITPRGIIIIIFFIKYNQI